MKEWEVFIAQLRSAVEFPKKKTQQEFIKNYLKSDIEDNPSGLWHYTKFPLICRHAVEIKIASPWYFLIAVIFVSCLPQMSMKLLPL